jgi:hypothetical protein
MGRSRTRSTDTTSRNRFCNGTPGTVAFWIDESNLIVVRRAA